MPLKLTGFAGNSRVRRILAVAALAGVNIEHDKSFTFASNWKTPEFLSKNPFGYLPILELEDGTVLRECSAIAEYVAELGANQTLIPSDLKAKAEVHSWQATADQELLIPTAILFHMLIGKIPYAKPVYQTIADRITGRINVIDTILATKTFLVGERITLADIFVVTSLTNIFTSWFDAPARAKVPNVIRYVETVVNHPKLVDIFTPLEFVEKTPAPQAPAKEQKAPKEAKPKAEKKPKEADEEEEEPLVPAEPKVKNPLDDLPKSSFNLEEWKRQYSNNDTRGAGGSLAWFYEKFDKEGFSIWRVDFKYNEELTQIFMSSNQIGGFFNRLEASRKYLFGSVGVLGKANDSVITGVLVARGQDIEPVVNVAPDWESYSFRRLNVNNADDKAFFEAAMAWDLVENGREWADGKNFKLHQGEELLLRGTLVLFLKDGALARELYMIKALGAKVQALEKAAARSLKVDHWPEQHSSAFKAQIQPIYPNMEMVQNPDPHLCQVATLSNPIHPLRIPFHPLSQREQKTQRLHEEECRTKQSTR
ncbi:hypothetical protein L204_103711 [Cryptococcus depauperatus]